MLVAGVLCIGLGHGLLLSIGFIALLNVTNSTRFESSAEEKWFVYVVLFSLVGAVARSLWICLDKLLHLPAEMLSVLDSKGLSVIRAVAVALLIAALLLWGWSKIQEELARRRSLLTPHHTADTAADSDDFTDFDKKLTGRE